MTWHNGAQLSLFNLTCLGIIFAILDPGKICDWEVIILNRFDAVTKITVWYRVGNWIFPTNFQPCLTSSESIWEILCLILSRAESSCWHAQKHWIKHNTGSTQTQKLCSNSTRLARWPCLSMDHLCRRYLCQYFPSPALQHESQHKQFDQHPSNDRHFRRRVLWWWFNRSNRGEMGEETQRAFWTWISTDRFDYSLCTCSTRAIDVDTLLVPSLILGMDAASNTIRIGQYHSLDMVSSLSDYPPFLLLLWHMVRKWVGFAANFSYRLLLSCCFWRTTSGLWIEEYFCIWIQLWRH